MKKNKITTCTLCVLLIISALLTGCSKDKVKSKKTKLETGSMQETSVVIKIGDTGVKYSEMRNYCYLLKRQYEDSFGKNLWKYKLDNDSTIGDEARQEVASLVTQLKIIRKTADEMQVALDSDEKDEALRSAEEIVNNASTEDKKSYCLSVQSMADLYEDNILAEKMFYVATDDADTVVTDDEARQIDIQYIQIITKGKDRNGTNISMDKKTKKEAAARAAKLLKEAKKAKDFLEFAEENTDAASVSATIGKDNELLGQSATAQALKLKKGRISNVIASKTSDGTESYFIIYCTDNNNEDATYARKEEIIEQRQINMFKEKYAEWLKDCDVKISQSFWETFEI
ncbi:MAG TPA: hypothetical protein DCZ23_04035 [Lachnospiraceae bacterium]|nr:hypothetical protein [Lachnospiraceae bacterium]